jgi:hypothetical protein
MKELIKYLVIRMTTRHAKTAIDIYKTLYNTKKDGKVICVDKPSLSVNSVPKSNSKKQELIDSLKYLKSKKTKTKKDRESIYTIEMVLKNM